MIQSMQYFYHPFKHESLSFFISIDSSRKVSSFNILDDVDLYQQPVEDPNVAIAFFMTRLVFTVLTETINYRVIYNSKKDNGILSDVTKLIACTNMSLVPIRLIFITLTDVVHPLNEVVGQWICSSYWVIDKISTQMIAYHSLMIALLRYIFVAHNDKVVNYGKERLKNLFWYLSFGIPIFNLLWVSTDLKEIDTDIPINRCNGVDHKAFLIQSWSSLGLIKTNFQSLQNDGQNDNFSKVFAVLRRLSKVGQRVWMIFLASNIGEGIIYYRLITHMTR